MLVDQFGRDLSLSELFRDRANKAVIGPGANVYAGGLSIAGMTPRKYMEQAQHLYYQNPWIRTAEGIVSKKLATSDWKVEIETEDPNDTEEQVTSGPAIDFLKLGSPLQHLTRSKLWQITSRHMGLCNNAFWYPDFRRPENGCIYVNPARVTPVPDAAGYLDFWLVDADDWGNDGVRFEADELLWFQLEAADVGFFGHGLVYSALLKANLSTQADRHALQVLETGGRLQGILTPTKDDYINDFAFSSMQRELRNVTELDDSAKRMVLLRKAVEFTRTTQTAGELELANLMRTSKEDIYEIWGVPRSQTGGMTEVGMNSGDRQSYEEAALWQNGIHPRAVVFEETVGLLLSKFDPRYELEIEEPEFDDERPLFEMLKMSEFAPMSRNERRRLIKLPPIPGKDGEIIEQNPGLLQVVPPMPIARSYITGRLQDGVTVELPNTPLDPQQHLNAINQARNAAPQTVGKAITDGIAERIIAKADHFLAKPGDLDMIAPKRLVAKAAEEGGVPNWQVADLLREVHDGLKAIVAEGQRNDWAVEEYAEAVRGAALVSDHLEHAAPVTSGPPPSPSMKSDDGQVTVTLPRVTVQPTPVNVQAVDMTPVAKAVTDLGDMIRAAIPEPVAPPVVEKLRRVVERDQDGRIVAIVDVPV